MNRLCSASRGIIVSTHASARDATNGLCDNTYVFKRFNSRVREGRDERRAAGDLSRKVSTHASARDATIGRALPSRRDGRFNSRVREGRDIHKVLYTLITMFQLTRPRGTRLRAGRLLAGYFQFQLTRPRGTRRAATPYRMAYGFNSRVREGRDSCRLCRLRYRKFQLTRPRGTRLERLPHIAEQSGVSTHASARDATRRFRPLLQGRKVSTHASARDATIFSSRHLAFNSCFNSRVRGGRDLSSLGVC